MKKAVFLDRDGVINKDKGYVHAIKDFEFIEGIFELLRGFQDKGYSLIVITNQAGIGRGYYTEGDFDRLNRWMLSQLKERNIDIEKVYYSPYHPEHGKDKYKKMTYCRKPNPGMILKAKEELKIDLSKSILIGDKETDIEAGIRAGVYMNILVSDISYISVKSKADLIFKDIKTLVKFNKCQNIMRQK